MVIDFGDDKFCTSKTLLIWKVYDDEWLEKILFYFLFYFSRKNGVFIINIKFYRINKYNSSCICWINLI